MPPHPVSDAIEGMRVHTLPKRTPWRHHDREIITTSPSDTYCKYPTSVNCPSHSARPLSLIYQIDNPRPHRRPPYNHDDHNSGQDDYGGRTRKYTPNAWSKLTPETWSDTDPSSEWQTEWRSTLPSAKS